jgi:hypothetical protein
MYPSYILGRARSIVASNLVSTSFSQTEQMEMFNDVIENLVADVKDRCPIVGAVTTTISQVQGTKTQTMPVNFDRFLSLYNPAANMDLDQRYPVDVLTQLLEGISFSDVTLWWVRCDETRTWTMLYTYKPIRCHRGVAGAITGPTDTPPHPSTIVLADPSLSTNNGTTWGNIRLSDDYYNRAQLYIVSATTGAGQTVTIDNYVGATRLATLESNWVIQPTGTVVYEILPMIDVQRWEALLMYEVAYRFMGVQQGKLPTKSLLDPYIKELTRFQRYWRRINSGMPKMMRQPLLELYAGTG